MIRATLFCLAMAGAHAMAGGSSDVRLELAKQWEHQGEFDRAAQELRLYLAEHPDDVSAYELMGDLRLRQGKAPQAIASYQAGLRRDTGNVALREKLGRAQASSTTGENTAARDTATVTVSAKTKPDSATGIYALPEFKLAIQAYQQGKKDEAQKHLRQVLGRSPNHPGAYYLGGVIRYENGEYDKAVFDFKHSFNYPEKGFNAHFYLGRIYQKQGKIREAVEAYQHYCQATQSEAGKRQVQGFITELQAKLPREGVKGEKPEVAKAKPTAVTSQPVKEGKEVNEKTRVEKPKPEKSATEGIAYPIGDGLLFVIADGKGAGSAGLEAARDLLKREKIENAVQALKKTQVDFAGSENGAVVPINLAAVYLKLGLWNQATMQAGEYVDAHRGGKFFRVARYLQALALMGQNQGHEAEPLLLEVRNGTGFGPPPEEVTYQLAKASAGFEDPKRQAVYLVEAEKGLHDLPRLAWIRRSLGEFWAREGDTTKAMGYFRKALEPCPDTVLRETCEESTLRLADLEFRRRAYKEAQALYSDLLRQNPRHKEAAWAQYQLGNIHKAGGDWEAALNAYQRVIDNYPESYWAAQAKWQKEDAVWRKEYEGVLH